MSKAVSYYDWKLSFKTKVNSIEDSLNKSETTNTLGISDNNFKNFMKEWKEKNLS